MHRRLSVFLNAFILVILRLLLRVAWPCCPYLVCAVFWAAFQANPAVRILVGSLARVQCYMAGLANCYRESVAPLRLA